MAIVDLSTRITNNWLDFHQNQLSSDSSIYINQDSIILDDGPASIDFSVGEKWFFQNDNTAYKVTNDGIILTPFQSILIETFEEIALPYNIFGLVTGKGLQIFQGTFISTGKINPGFNGKLKIGIYNGSKKKIKLYKNKPLCTCVFFEMESNLKVPIKNQADLSVQLIKPIGKKLQFVLYLKENKEIIAIFISVLALTVSFSSLIFN